jgi:hypothetical protein
MGSGSKGIYWQEGDGAYWHIYPRNQADMRFRTGSGNGGIVGTVADETARGYIHWTTSNEIGFLSEDRNWVLRTYNRGVEVYGELRAPIFYDSSDTTFYVDPNSSSRVRNLYVGDGGSNWSDPGGWGTQLHVSNGPHSIIRVYARNEGIETGMFSHTGGQSKVGSFTNHDFSIVRNFSDRMIFYSGYTYANGYLQAADSLRAPIFYDSNDTNYYVDPASGSNLYGGNGSFVIQGTWPQLRIAQNDGTPDASINYDAGDGYRKWNVGPGAGEAEGDEFGFAIYEGTRGTLYSTPLRINALTGYVQIGDRDNPAYQLDVSGYGYFRDNIGVATTPRSDAYKISMGGSIHLNGNSVDYVGSLYLEGSGTGGHLQPNAGSYGTLQITGSKSGWAGLRFTDSAVTLMMNTNESGHHNDNYGWQFRWQNGTLYCHKNAYGG